MGPRCTGTAKIWLRALWIFAALGAHKADRIIFGSQFGFAPDTSFGAAARKTVETAMAMYGAPEAALAAKAFAGRGTTLYTHARVVPVGKATVCFLLPLVG